MTRRKCCCPSCVYFQDDFSVDDLATNWEVQSGEWIMGGGSLAAPIVTGVVACTPAAGAQPPHIPFLVDVTLTAAVGQTATIYLDDQHWDTLVLTFSDDNYSLTISQFGASTFQTFSVASYPFVLPLRICRTTKAIQVGYLALPIGGTSATPQVSLAGSVAFSQFRILKHRDDDPACYSCDSPCDLCAGGYGPGEWR